MADQILALFSHPSLIDGIFEVRVNRIRCLLLVCLGFGVSELVANDLVWAYDTILHPQELRKFLHREAEYREEDRDGNGVENCFEKSISESFMNPSIRSFTSRVVEPSSSFIR